MDRRTLIVPSFTSLCESVYAFSLDDDLGRLDLGGAALREPGGSLSSGLSSLHLSHCSRLCRSSGLLGRGELGLSSAFLPRFLFEWLSYSSSEDSVGLGYILLELERPGDTSLRGAGGG